jgi:hypothetical protein
MTAAERSRRYRARRKASRVTVPESSPVERVTAALDTLCDLAEVVTAAELAEMLGPVGALGVDGDIRWIWRWLGRLQVLAAERARGPG